MGVHARLKVVPDKYSIFIKGERQTNRKHTNFLWKTLKTCSLMSPLWNPSEHVHSVSSHRRGRALRATPCLTEGRRDAPVARRPTETRAARMTASARRGARHGDLRPAAVTLRLQLLLVSLKVRNPEEEETCHHCAFLCSFCKDEAVKRRLWSWTAFEGRV